MYSKKCAEGLLARLLVISGKRQEVNADEVVASLGRKEEKKEICDRSSIVLMCVSALRKAR